MRSLSIALDSLREVGVTTTREASDLIGRRDERAAVERFLDALQTGPAAFVISGEAGIGKSTVWRAGVSSARSRSFRVLLSRPAEAEAGLSFIALADLLEGIPEDVIASLPQPQRDSLGVTLRRADATGELDRVALARGALTAISSVATDRPTVVAIDDAQWLDAPSRDALRFVFRRLVGGERVGLFATVRADDAGAPLEIDAALPPDRITRRLLRPLAPGELERLVRLRADISLPRPSWRAVHRVSGGNPFFALQIAEAVARKGGLAPGEEPPLPESVTAALRDRLASLSGPVRRTLLHAAALGKPTAALLHAAAADDAALDAALEERVLELEGDRLRFTHPLLAAATYGEASAAERREAHRLLAEVVDDPEERAVHLGPRQRHPGRDDRRDARGRCEPGGTARSSRDRGRARPARRATYTRRRCRGHRATDDPGRAVHRPSRRHRSQRRRPSPPRGDASPRTNSCRCVRPPRLHRPGH